MKEYDGNILMIDPPVGPYSSKEEIENWIVELEQMEDREETRAAIASAKRMLRLKAEMEK